MNRAQLRTENAELRQALKAAQLVIVSRDAHIDMLRAREEILKAMPPDFMEMGRNAMQQSLHNLDGCDPVGAALLAGLAKACFAVEALNKQRREQKAKAGQEKIRLTLTDLTGTKRLCLRCELSVASWTHFKADGVMSPRGISHVGLLDGTTGCGLDATRPGWSWPV